MSIINSDFLSRNSSRKYPLDDTASGVSDSGVMLPESLIVDANLWVPEIEFDGGATLKYLYLSSAMISEYLVSITVLGTSGPVKPANAGTPGTAETPFVPIFSLSIAKSDLVPYKNYAVESQQEGVGGWVMFGNVADAEPVSLLFSSPAQSMLLPRVARYYTSTQSPGISVGQFRTLVLGDAELVADVPVAVSNEERMIDGVGMRNVIEFNMVGQDGGTPTAETLNGFAGPCGGRPESGTCTRNPVKFFNGVEPDENGKLTIEFQGLTVRTFDDGLCIDSEQGLADACANTVVNSPSIECELTTPYTNDFSTYDDFVSGNGYFFIDTNELYCMTGGYSSASGGFCFATMEDGLAARTFSLTISQESPGMEIGMYFCDLGATRVVVSSGGDVFAENKSTGVRTALGSVGSFGTEMLVLVLPTKSISGVAIPDEYWSAEGGTGIVVYNESNYTVKFSQYGVTDV